VPQNADEEISEYTKYEIARMVGSRALQISMGAPFNVKLDEEDLKRIRYNPIEIAKLELEAGVLPITVRRPYPIIDAKPKK
jgi:DNA-directed RNA polymerase subunit K/omega